MVTHNCGTSRSIGWFIEGKTVGELLSLPHSLLAHWVLKFPAELVCMLAVLSFTHVNELGILPLALFCKTPVDLVLTGITNDSTDLSVDILKSVTLPLLQNFGVWGASLVVKQRGCMPGGGGIVELKIPPVKTALKPLHVTEEGLVKRVRGELICLCDCAHGLSRFVFVARALVRSGVFLQIHSLCHAVSIHHCVRVYLTTNVI